VVIDPRGTGAATDRIGPGNYGDLTAVGDLLAVMDDGARSTGPCS
jgi:hypothetical protein